MELQKIKEKIEEKNWLFFFFYIEYFRVIYLKDKYSTRYIFWKFVFPNIWYVFNLLRMLLEDQVILSFFVEYALILSKTYLLIERLHRFFSYIFFSCTCFRSFSSFFFFFPFSFPLPLPLFSFFSISSFTSFSFSFKFIFRSITYFELIFVYK